MWNIWGLLFLYFFQNRPRGQTRQQIFTQNDLNDVDSRIDVPFAVKIKTLFNPWPQALKTAKIWNYWGGTFSLDFTFNISGLKSINTPYSSSESRKSVTVNSEIGVGDSKYVVDFDPYL